MSSAAADQRSRREAERAVRAHVAMLAEECGLHLPAVADLLGLLARTVRGWTRADAIAPSPSRGRPRAPLSPARELEVLELLRTAVHRPGLPSLQAMFPGVARSALRALRDRVIAEQHAEGEALIWTTPGTVWSADFTRPPRPIDGEFRRILLVRDLASHCLLLALPCESESAGAVAAALRALFAEHGPHPSRGLPLVIKTDNGSTFVCEQGAGPLVEHAMAHLRGPPLTPRYNGSIERSAGCLKARIAQIVTRRGGEPGCWTSDDIETARITANTLCRPWGPSRPTPQECWDARPRISPRLRARFVAQVARCQRGITRTLLTQQVRRGLPRATTLSAGQRATVARAAIRRALVALGLLRFRRTANMSTHSRSKNGKD